MAASLAPLSNLNVPSQTGYQLPLDGSGSNSPTQTFTATSDNPHVLVQPAQGPFWTIKVSHQASSTPGDVTFTDQPMTFQLFPGLTPNTVSQITNLTNSGFYVNQGKFFPRIVKNFVAQGGSTSATSTPPPPPSSGVPSIATEIVQQLAFNGSAQLAMANTGQPNSTQAQFFVTYGAQTSLDYLYSLFGQLVAGQNTLTDLSNVTVHSNGSTTMPEVSVPDSQVTITSASLSQTNPNGVLLIDATSAAVNQTANITVTATDPKDGSHVTRTFKVNVTAPPTIPPTTMPPINFIPAAIPQSISTAVNTPLSVTLTGQGSPDTSNPGTLSFKIISPPSHGTITPVNPATGTLVYTPTAGFRGGDTFQFDVTATYSKNTPTQITSLPSTVSVLVGAEPTGAVHLIDNVLVVTPVPRTDRGTDNIHVTGFEDQTVDGGQRVVVFVNGVPDTNDPPTSSLDQIVVFGGKASTDIQVDPNVLPTVPVTLDGGHGGDNVIQAGSGPTREHGWFGHTLLIGGTGSDALIGRKGFVRFKPTPTTNLIYAGNIKPRFSHRTVEPTGTFYRFEKGRLVPVLTT